LKGVDVLFICNYLGKSEAGYRRLSYFVKYMQFKGLKVTCTGIIHLTSQGIVKSSKGCFSVPLSVSSRNIAFLPINILLSLPLVLLILILRPKTVIISIPDSYLVLVSYIGSSLTKAKFIVDVRDPQEEILTRAHKKGLSGFVARIYKRINYAVYRRAYAVIGVTSSLVKLLAKEIGRSMCLIPNGADLDVFKPTDKSMARKKLGLNQDSFLIAFTGVLSWYYDILPTLVALRRVRERLGIDIRLVIAGPLFEGRTKKVLEAFRDVATYLGLLNVNSIVAMLSACDVGLIPLIEDPIFNLALPAKFYEYVAMGLPLIVTANRGSELANIVEKRRLGFLCEPGDIVCLESTITLLVGNRNLLENLRENAFTFREYVDRRVGAERLFRLISKLL
jgi:glycosyltransferase involved in cell wall biosynthesis